MIHSTRLNDTQSASGLWWTLLAMLLSMVLLGTMLFSFRQRRLELSYQITKLHSQIDRSRTDLWDQQARIIALSKPPTLWQAIKDQGLFLEPVIGSNVGEQNLFVAVQSNRGGSTDGGY